MGQCYPDLNHAEKGELQGQRILLRRMVEGAFGPLSAAALARLEAMSSERLLELGEKFRKATSLADLGLDEGTNGTPAAP
jgi:hypothetical protein